MGLIDEDGRLFGLVNVIDALAVIVVATVIVAGVAFVLQPEPESPARPETATTRAVLDLGTQPGYVVEQVSPGDTSSPGPSSELTVTDVHVAPADGGVRTLVGVELTGVANGDSISFDGEPPSLGRELAISTDVYQVSGAIRRVDSSLASSTTGVLLETTVDAATATRIDPGDTYALAGRDVATVESVESYATGNPDRRRVFVGLSLNTVDFGDGPQYGDEVVRPGGQIPFETAEYSVTGQVRRVGSVEPRGEPTTRTVTLELTNVDPQFANGLRPGMAQTAGDTTVARVTDVQTEPATVVLTSRDGDIHRRDHPVQRDVTLTVELRVRETTDGPTFAGRSLQRGSTVVLDLGATTIEAEVVSL